MSMSFPSPVNDEVLAKIKETFGEPVAHDRKTFLFDKMFPLQQQRMKEIANAAKQSAVVEINGEDTIKTMSDGTQYRVTSKGWLKIT